MLTSGPYRIFRYGFGNFVITGENMTNMPQDWD